jgi:XTP/dITP diphosphohydrolase
VTPILEFVLATANADKAREIAEIVGPSMRLQPRPPWAPDVEETENTLVGNARLKARAIASATGTAALADDTGLEVEDLGGAPGVYAARYAGEAATYEDNVAKLLASLAEVTHVDGVSARRRARFRTVAVASWPDGREVVAEGAVEGTIASEPRGEGGFGYDPVFIPDEGDGRTFAEMGAEEKHRWSHRGRAFRALAARLQPGGPAYNSTPETR